jgi:hypothetical protein
VVPPCSGRISRVPPYSSPWHCITCTGLSPAKAQLSRWFHLSLPGHWPSPRSLATTSGVSVDVLSSGYLDVSVPRVCFYSPMYSGIDTFLVITGNPKPYPRTNMTSKFRLSKVGFPIRKSAGQRLFAPHHSLSQRTTSFIASYRQGIHQMPLGHLIALISNARHFTIKPATPLEGWAGFPATRQGEHCSERPEFEINPNEAAVAAPCASAPRQSEDWHARHISSLRCPGSPPALRAAELFSLQRLQQHPLYPTHLMVEPDGIEPTTSCLQSTRSPS